MGAKQTHRTACRPQTFTDDGVAVCGHDEPMYFFGGKWRCGVRVRERVSRDYIARYDADPIFRITKNLKRNRERRLETLGRARERLRVLREEGSEWPGTEAKTP